MEQLWFLMTEYSGGIFMAMGILLIILLAVALHKINRLDRKIRQMTDKVQEHLEQRTECAAAPMEQAAESDGQTEDREDLVQERDAEMLIHAVLDEVFS